VAHTIVAVLRISGDKFDVDRFVQNYAITPDISWRDGVSDSVGRVRSNSGFNLTIADAPSTKTLISQITSWIQQNEDALMALGTAGASGTVDIGLTVGTSEPFTSSIVLAPQELTRLSGFGLALSVSASPASDP
jgi:hypothetical protein